MFDFAKTDIRIFNEKAQRILEVSDIQTCKDLFGDCDTISDVNDTAESIYNDIFCDMYGISIQPGNFSSARVYRFEDRASAEKWVDTEEYDFREREISHDPEYIKFVYKDYLPDDIDLDDIANDL